VILLVLRVGAIYAGHQLAGVFLNMQDRWLLLVELGLWGIAFVPLWRGWRARPLTLPDWRWTALLGLGVALLCYAGHYALLMGYDLSRDEQMASFDGWIYGHGRLAWPLPPAWQPDAAMLNLLFMLPVERPAAWVSAYLPGHALLRAGVGAVADPALTGPLLTGLSVILLAAIARKLWPRGSEAGAVALLAFVLSGQLLFTGMTAYAMPAHLACDLLWLWLFLQDRRRTDLAALAVGFLATGLHQPLFHPLFVAPWLALALVRRRWARCALFVIAYGAIGLFWLHWPAETLALVRGPHSGLPDAPVSYLGRLLDTLGDNSGNLAIMAANLLRFCTWQSLLPLPLLLAGIWAARRHAEAAALAAGLLLPIVVMTAILPYQGHGFGYRYVHAALGNAALLAGYGWQSLAANHARLRMLLWRAALLSLVVLLPVQAWFAHRLYAPFAAASARIDASHADYAIIGYNDGPYALDLVLNRPDLGNRPIRLSASEIDDADALAARLCSGHVTVALPADSFFTDSAAVFANPVSGDADKRIAEYGPIFTDAGCRVTVLR
jgi:hypothetical protein